MNLFFKRASLVVLALLLYQMVGRAETVSIGITSNRPARGIRRGSIVQGTCLGIGLDLVTEKDRAKKADHYIVVSHPDLPSIQKLVKAAGLLKLNLGGIDQGRLCDRVMV